MREGDNVAAATGANEGNGTRDDGEAVMKAVVASRGKRMSDGRVSSMVDGLRRFFGTTPSSSSLFHRRHRM